jgi:mycoredoxin
VSEGGSPLSGEIVMYTTPWCGYCVRLKHFFAREGITYREVNIERDDEAADFVQGVNNGNYTVPTLRMPGGAVLTNPAPAQILAGLERTA